MKCLRSLIWLWLALARFFARLSQTARKLSLLISDKDITMTRKDWIKAAFAALLIAVTPLAFAVEAPQETTQQVTQLDINSADARSIAQALEGVGLVKAQEIVNHREMFGKFSSIDELTEVQGIGAATVEKNRHRILIVNN